LNLEATEKLDKNRRYCSRNRELFAQGIGNVLAGLCGGIPITSVIIRSSVNIQAGAKTKCSTIVHGLLFIITVLLISEWINKIALAALAAILIYVGYKLTRVSIYRAMYQKGFAYYFPFIVTVITIVATNIILGVIIGLICSILFILKENSRMRLDIIAERHDDGIHNRLILPQELSFLKKAALAAELAAVPENSHLILDARPTKYMDQDIVELIKDFAKNFAYEKKISLNLLGFKSQYAMHDHINYINVSIPATADLTPEKILNILREGNRRFVTDQRINRYFPLEIKATAKNQHPLAVVLSCIDSRIPVETIFDMGMGDLFIVRVAGNVVNDDVIGSIEFACHLAGAKLIVVLGHTRCGAIQAACDYHDNGYIAKLLQKIIPAIHTVRATQIKQFDQETILNKISQQNIENSLKQLYDRSPVIQSMIDAKQVGLVSGMYDIRSGLVAFYHKSWEVGRDVN
jgi:carbonic anhydrase